MSAAELDLAIGNSLDAMPEVKVQVETFCREAAISTAIRRRLLVVVDELVHNSIHYGCRHLGAQARIHLRLLQSGNHLDLEVRDNGTPPFNPLEVAPPDLEGSVATREIGGLGIHLVRGLSSRFGYSFEDGWNVIRIAIDLT